MSYERPFATTVEFDLRKYDWWPENVQEIVKHVGDVFDKQLFQHELEIIGTNHLDRSRIWNDELLQTWIEFEGSRFSDKVLKITVPPRVLSFDFKPGEVPVLAKGRRIATFDGDGRADMRTQEFSLRIFDCGHFVLKESNQSHRDSPAYWVVFEGRYRRTERGYRLEILIRYPRIDKRSRDFNIQAIYGGSEASLNFSGNEERNLKGFLPTIMGNGSSCWAALVRKKEHPRQSKCNRLGDEEKDPDDDDDEKEKDEDEEEDDDFNGPQKQELVQSLLRELSSEQQQELRHALGKHGMTPDLYQDLSPPLRKALQRLQNRAQVAKRRREYAAEGEPTWPMYLGLALFVFVFAVFAYVWYEERTSSDVALDIDEDDYWKKDQLW